MQDGEIPDIADTGAGLVVQLHVLGFGASNLHLLLAFTTSSGVLLLADHARLLEMLALFDFRQQPGLLTLLFEAFQCEFDRLAVLDPDTQHCDYHLLICCGTLCSTGLYIRKSVQ